MMAMARHGAVGLFLLGLDSISPEKMMKAEKGRGGRRVASCEDDGCLGGQTPRGLGAVGDGLSASELRWRTYFYFQYPV